MPLAVPEPTKTRWRAAAAESLAEAVRIVAAEADWRKVRRDRFRMAEAIVADEAWSALPAGADGGTCGAASSALEPTKLD